MILKRIQNMSVHAKLASVLTLLSSSLVVVMALLFIADKMITFRSGMVENHRSLARTLGANSAAAILFDDSLSAEHVLESLSEVGDVVDARIRIPSGKLFARYERNKHNAHLMEGAEKVPPLLQPERMDGTTRTDGYSFHDGFLDMAAPIKIEGKTVGYIELRADLHQLYNKVQLSIIIVVGLLVAVAVLVQLISFRMQRFIARPLHALLRSVEAVKQEKDYSFRVQKFNNDEFGELTDGFNDMLAELERRDSKLERHRVDLEEIVARRTGEIERKNKELIAKIEEKRQVEDRLARAERMEAIGTLAAGVAHDLNNILSGVVSYPELLLMKLPADHEMRKPLTTIQTSGQKAAAIVQDLLTLSRRGVAVIETVDLDRVVDEYLGSVEYGKLKSAHPHLRIERSRGVEEHTIKGSAVHLGKVVMNLVTNSMEAMAVPGAIRISLDHKYLEQPVEGYDSVVAGDYVRLSVSDEGHGISREDMRFIFEPFYTKKKMGMSGTGLGMTVVWGTVADHHGYIEVQSKVGRGTTFSLYFPASVEEAAVKVVQEDQQFRGQNEKILVVDDIYEQRSIAREILEELGYRVTTAHSGEKAVEILKDSSFDLLLLDMVMEPGIDGLETFRQAARIDPSIKAVIASGYAETRRLEMARDLGISRIVRKPYTIGGLAKRVREELAHDKVTVS